MTLTWKILSSIRVSRSLSYCIDWKSVAHTNCVQGTRDADADNINHLLEGMILSEVISILVWSFYLFEFKTTFTCKLVVIVEISKIVSSITLIMLTVKR